MEKRRWRPLTTVMTVATMMMMVMMIWRQGKIRQPLKRPSTALASPVKSTTSAQPGSELAKALIAESSS